MNFTFRPRLNVASAVPKSLFDAMHEKSLEVLERIGIQVSNEKLVGRIKGRKGFELEGGRVKIRGYVVEDLVAEVRKRRKGRDAGNEEEVVISPGYPGCSKIVDLETDKIEPLTTDKLIEAAKLVDSLYDWGVRGEAPGAPVDVPPKLRRVAQCMIGYEYCRSAGPAPFESYEEAVYIKRMAEAMGQGFGIPIYVVSPLRLEGISVDRAIPFLERGECEWISVSSMPLAGSTAPVYPVGAFIQGMSEALGGYAILHEAYPGVSVGFGINAYHFDMRYGNIVIGSPEQTLMDLFSIALGMYYGGGLYGSRSLRTMAKGVDAQAQVEKASSATVGVLTGPGTFVHGGELSIDELFSPVQLVLDCEIARYLARLAKGLEFSEEQIELSLQAMERCAAKGYYLADETTRRDHKRIFWAPTLFDDSLLHTSKGGTDIIGRAKEICRERISRHDFILDPKKKEKIGEIYREAAKNLS
ncbi:MAG: trimethylamine methyltransferase family protein [Candidatus Brockarchaeota archaeon]|nr:trimethylamine methyltransferase family protein [Candidatus Brockarchaeota archaeon]